MCRAAKLYSIQSFPLLIVNIWVTFFYIYSTLVLQVVFFLIQKCLYTNVLVSRVVGKCRDLHFNTVDIVKIILGRGKLVVGRPGGSG